MVLYNPIAYFLDRYFWPLLFHFAYLATLCLCLSVSACVQIPVVAEEAQPPTVACKMEAQSEHVRVAHTSLHVWAPICHAQSGLIDEISASELSQEFY